MDIKKWIRDFFAGKEDEQESLSSLPDQKTIERLIDKTINQNLNQHEEKDSEVADDCSSVDLSSPTSDSLSESVAPGDEGGKPSGESDGCCPYGVKRNIVSSIAEVRRFAEEHKLAAEIVKALLKILAEIMINALKGKVSAGTLLILLNALNFDSARDEAFKEGERAGRNAKIEEEYFPKVDDGLPRFHGTVKPRPTQRDDIFTLARNA